jgi:hypothetical protein
MSKTSHIKISLLHAVTKLAEKLENLRDHLHFISSLLTASKWATTTCSLVTFTETQQ